MSQLYLTKGDSSKKTILIKLNLNQFNGCGENIFHEGLCRHNLEVTFFDFQEENCFEKRFLIFSIEFWINQD